MARGIYKIINVINNKFYVGSAVNLRKRKSRHFSELRNGNHRNRHLQAAWLKYGEQAFVFVVVEELSESCDLLAAENVWLKAHVGKEYCYNIGTDATAPQLGMFGPLNGAYGSRHTDEAKARIGAASRNRRQDAETIKRKTAHLIGKPRKAETRAKISAALQGEGNFWYGKKRPEHGAKVSKPVLVTKPDGTQVRYNSITELRQALGLTPTSVNRAIKSGKPFSRGPNIGMLIQYV